MKLAESSKLKKIIFDRLDEAQMRPTDLIKDAEERGMKINASSFSKYKKGEKGGLTDEQILWICCRLDITINLNFGNATIDNNQIKWVIPKFDELKAIKNINKIFGNG